MADLSWAAALAALGGGGGGGGTSGKSITSAKITEEGELEFSFSDGTTQNVGRVVGKDGKVYVPHVDEHNVLTFTLEDEPQKAPDPVDLVAADEWGEIEDPSAESTSVWEEL